ncbi:hypothetical protein ACFPRL_32010 [Pseudoclavibacter helvolus]
MPTRAPPFMILMPPSLMTTLRRSRFQRTHSISCTSSHAFEEMYASAGIRPPRHAGRGIESTSTKSEPTRYFTPVTYQVDVGGNPRDVAVRSVSRAPGSRTGSVPSRRNRTLMGRDAAGRWCAVR